MDNASSSTITKLNGSNYSSWKFQIKLVLMEKDLWSFIEPGETPPAVTDVEKTRVFISRQGKTFSKICLNIESNQQQHVKHLSDPKDVWDELEKLYAPKDSKFRIVQLRRSLYSEKLIMHSNLESYLAKINHVVSELTNVGYNTEDDDLAMIILCGLSDDWDTVVSSICNLPQSDFNCSNVKRRLIAEVERRNLQCVNEGVEALTVKAAVHPKANKIEKPVERPYYRKHKIICFKCHEAGHFAKHCKNAANENTKYNSRHLNDVKYHRPPKGDKQASNFTVMCDSLETKVSDTWIIDSGASHHMTPKREYFSQLNDERENLPSVILADGKTMSAAGIGVINAHIINPRGSVKKFQAKNTILVPEMKHNVLSVKQMIDNNYRVIFDKNGCHILDSGNNTVIKAEKSGGLFTVKTSPFSEYDKEHAFSITSRDDKLSLNLWHKRLMHVSNEKILQMSKVEAVQGLNCKIENAGTCDDCLAGKAKRQPFPKLSKSMNPIVVEALELVHADLMGPFSTASLGGSRYILSIIDEATRFVFVYFLNNKGSVLKKFKQWQIETEKQSNRTLKRVRTDNGLEFCSNAWDMYCKAHGIIHERTMVYTPQQNGVAERMNLTLFDLVRSVINSSNLPKTCWAELVNTAAYIRNRVTNKHNDEQTPYELWFNRKPSVRHFRSIGCEVFVHTPKQKQKSKLDSRAQKGILVGYALNGRGWRIWMPVKRNIVESRDCVFKEDSFDVSKETKQSTNFQEVEEMSEESEDEDIQAKVDAMPKNEISDLLPATRKGQESIHPMTLRSRTTESVNSAYFPEDSISYKENLADVSKKPLCSANHKKHKHRMLKVAN